MNKVSQGRIPMGGVPQTRERLRREIGHQSREGLPINDTDTVLRSGEPLVEMRGISIKYGDRQVLGHYKRQDGNENGEGLWWTVKGGERWGVFGPNGEYPFIPFNLALADDCKVLKKQLCSL